ncbi:MAG: hypothetical protein ABEI86_06755, partial [Halobacteriaceae archaeon]
GSGAIGSVSAANGEKKIPVAKAGDKVLQTEKVPRRWWEHVLDARKLNNKLTSRFIDLPGVVSVDTRRSEQEIAGRKRMVITIGVTEGSNSLKVPSSQNGVPIQVIERDPVKLTSCVHQGPYDTVSPGVQFQSNNAEGTATTEVGWNGNCPYMLSAAHIWDACDQDITGLPAGQEDG